MTDPHKVHHYHVACVWRGSTGVGYDTYDRSHELRATTATPAIAASSDPAFHGKAERLNPEQLLVMATASCQMLAFLAIAARARLDVVEYEDQAEGFMPENDKPPRITRILLKPRIVLRSSAKEERVRHFVEQAHHECYIANSLKTEIELQPQIVMQT